MNDDLEKVVERVLIAGLDDWVSVDEVYDICSLWGPRGYDLGATVESLLIAMSDQGLAIFGTMEDGFTPWGTSDIETGDKIREFVARNPILTPPSYEFLLSLTQKGQQLAENLAAGRPDLLED